MYIVLCDRCGQEIRGPEKRAMPDYPLYSVEKLDRDPNFGSHTEHLTLCPACREQLKAFLCCADRAPVTATLARKRALRRARLRNAMEGAAYDAEEVSRLQDALKRAERHGGCV